MISINFKDTCITAAKCNIHTKSTHIIRKIDNLILVLTLLILA